MGKSIIMAVFANVTAQEGARVWTYIFMVASLLYLWQALRNSARKGRDRGAGTTS